LGSAFSTQTRRERPAAINYLDEEQTIQSSAESAMVGSSDGCTLAVFNHGGSGPDLLIAHATGFNAAAYGPLANDLVASFRVWTMDLRGHGQSTPYESGLRWQAFADDIGAAALWIKARDGYSGTLCAFGHSMGGSATIIAAIADRRLFDQVMTYEPIVFTGDTNGEGAQRAAAAARNRREIFASRSSALEHFASKPPLNSLRADALAGYVAGGFIDLADGTVRLACRGAFEADVLSATDKLTIDELDKLETPITFCTGRPTAQVPFPAMSSAAAKRLGLPEPIAHKDIGHLGPLESPSTIASTIRSVIRDADK
jgi:pimeloyl-ACP methyl ester carboxylesterase